MKKNNNIDKLTGKECLELMKIWKFDSKEALIRVYGTDNLKKIEKLIDENGWKKFYSHLICPKTGKKLYPKD